jgi:hypothetical protein
MYYNVKLRRVSFNNCHIAQAMSITYSECVFVAIDT